ncbi:glycosyltransferase family 52 [Pasteurella atlantica]|nr:glycosyltransferase family 52 [Pasteurella atlantica]
MTPLQMLIAEKIIELHSEDKFYAIVLGQKENSKYYYYANRLKEKCIKLEFIEQPSFNNKLLIFFFIIKFKLKGIILPNINKIFLANIHFLPLLGLLSTLRFKEINTFDDGLANIDNTSFLFTKREHGFLKRIILSILVGGFYKENIKEFSKIHYTIYKDLPNIIINTSFISLLPENTVWKKNNGETSNIVKIFLGQPIFENSNISDKNIIKKNINLIKLALKYCKADYFFPHPRENYKVDGIKNINTSLIFEDYIIKLIKNNPRNKYIIYTFFSGAVLNVINLPNIEVVSLRHHELPEIWNNAYNVLEKFNIKIEII